MRLDFPAPSHGLVRLACGLAAVVLSVLATAGLARAQAAPRWRAVVVDTFNTRLNSPEDVALTVSRAANLHANALFVQVRRRGDALYLDPEEPLPAGLELAPDFDPLSELLDRAHAAGLEVHALLSLGPVWQLATDPPDPRHVFLRHGFSGGRAVEGAENWLTRTLLPDGNGTSMDGYRFGVDYWLDFGHPAAANYVVDVVTRLVERYAVDGVVLDALHYPEAPQSSASIGYNAVSLARFQRRTGQAGTPPADDPRWSEWRREQITALVRRIAVSVYAIRPSAVVTATAVGSGDATIDPRGTVAYTRTFQPWMEWAADGSVDVVVPQVYRQEHTAAGAEQFAGWLNALGVWPATRTRSVVTGIGAYLNSAEGLVRQIRATSAATTDVGGVALFSLAASNAPVVNNPLSLPAGRDTPQRPIEDIASVLRTGRTTGGQIVDPIAGPVFATQVPRPVLPWKAEVGHVLGQINGGDGTPMDGAAVQLESTTGLLTAAATSDGSGVFAVPSVAPGTYRLRVTSPSGETALSSCTIDVMAQGVARVTLTASATQPGVAACPSPTTTRRP